MEIHTTSLELIRMSEEKVGRQPGGITPQACPKGQYRWDQFNHQATWGTPWTYGRIMTKYGITNRLANVATCNAHTHAHIHTHTTSRKPARLKL